MTAIPIFRAAHLFPYLELLHKLGAPVERGLRQAGLPINYGDQSEAQFPLLKTLQFLTTMAHNEGIDDMALRAREHCKVKELSPLFLASLYASSTLKLALDAFIRLARLENTHLDVWMFCEDIEVKIVSRHRIPFDMEKSRHLELNTNMMLVSIVRAFAGPAWCPDEMAFRSSFPLGRYAEAQFPNTRFLTGRENAWIAFPQSLLSLAPTIRCHIGSPQLNLELVVVSEYNFPLSLKQVLKSYLADGYPHIGLAADIAGTSVRTLQRKLKQCGLNYSALVRHAQFESAAQLLREPELRTLDIAYAVGYDDPSNFARAFRRIAGVSPKEYREQQKYKESP